MSSISGTGSSTASTALGGTPSSSNGITGLNASGISFQGLVSGLNTNQIIQGLLAPEQQVITDLQNQQAQLTQRETAYTTLQADLTALQTSLNTLSPTTNSIFDGRTVTSSNTAVATGSASAGAAPGVYTFTVNNLAQAQILSSQGFDSATSTITQGTFTIQVGSNASQTITINGTNNTLQGLASAINAASAGVTASVVSDGSTYQGNHLVLTANQPGTANAITITNNLAASSGGAMRPELNATYVGNAVTGSGWSGTATPVSNSGSGNYTGSNNDTFTFTVTNGGNYNNAATTISYTNASGSITGTIAGNNLHNNSFYAIPGAEGIGLEFTTSGGNTLVTGQTFTIKGFNPNTQAAANTSVTIGSGSGALTVSSSSNTFQNLFPGVTVNVQSASTTPVTLTVANNVQGAATAVDSFVSAYNAVVSFLNQNDSYNAQTQQGGILLGDYHATGIMNRLGQSATAVVAGVNAKANELSAVGITVNADGTLSVNNTTLNNALSGQLSGVSVNDVRRLFVQDAVASNSAVSFAYAPTSIRAVGSPVTVNITQAATQGAATGSHAVASSTNITSSNNTFTVTVNGHTSGVITLPTGTYTQAALAAQVQSSVNADPVLSSFGSSVTASLNGSNDLVLTSNVYGSSSTVTVNSGGSALSPLGFNGGETGTGTDVAGTYTYNGVTESATGSGQTLTGNSTNKYTAGLVVVSTLTSSQLGSGNQGTVTITQGVGAQLSNVLGNLLNSTTGQLALANQSLQNQASNISQQITVQQQAIQQQQQQLLREFSNMETVLAQLQAASSSLSNSLPSLTLPSGINGSSTTH